MLLAERLALVSAPHPEAQERIPQEAACAPEGHVSRPALILGSLGPPAPPRLRSPPRALERLDLVTRASKSHCRTSLPLPAPDTETMWTAKPSTRVSALLLLALALSPPGTQGRPQRRRATRVAELRPELFLPVTGTRLTPRASRSTGKPCMTPDLPFLKSDHS